MRLVLASGSPRRAQVLSQLGVDFVQVSPEVDETQLPGESPSDYVERLARAKALAVVDRDSLVVGADTVVVDQSQVLGKPAHPDQARAMLRRLQGSSHEVVTGLAVAVVSDRVEIRSLVDRTSVRMLPMTELEVAEYVDTGEPMDKAGAYALQGRAARFISAVEGSPYTVIGLPVHLLSRLVASVGADLTSFMVAASDQDRS